MQSRLHAPLLECKQPLLLHNYIKERCWRVMVVAAARSLPEELHNAVSKQHKTSAANGLATTAGRSTPGKATVQTDTVRAAPPPPHAPTMMLLIGIIEQSPSIIPLYLPEARAS